MKKRKSLNKKIQRLKTRLSKDAKKLAKLTMKLGADVTKGKSKGKQATAPSKRVAIEKSEAPPKVKKKLNLTPERRAQLAAAMKARWVAKRAAEAANSQGASTDQRAPATEASPPPESWRGVVG